MESTTKPVRGDIRSDGRIFWQRYTRRGTVRELWLKPSSFAKKEAARISFRNRNRESINDGRRARYANNAELAELTRARSREYRLKNRAMVLVRQRVRSSLVKTDPVLSFEKNHYFSAKKIGAVPHDFDSGIVRGLAQTIRRVSECTGIRFSLDHVIPLARGGEHHHRNLQVIPLRINQMKSFRTQEEFEQFRSA